MTPNEQIYDSIWHWPSLYWNRSEVLSNWFYVIGTGYEWKDGRICEPYESTSSRDNGYRVYGAASFELGEIKRFLALDLPFLTNEETMDQVKDCQDSMRRGMAAVEKENRKTRSIHDFIDELVQWREPLISLYPESEYSLINKIPDDVLPEWQAAADEARQDAEAFRTKYGDTMPPYDFKTRDDRFWEVISELKAKRGY